MTDREPSRGARGGRFSGALAPAAAALNASIGFDGKLLPFDVAGSIAHAHMLARIGVLSADDALRIETGLQQIEAKIAGGELALDPALEDIHMNVEAHLAAAIGDAGKRLHTARSRNDQVATDLKLYARHHAAALASSLDDLMQALCEQAEAHLDTLMPGYTHLQRAQPVRLAHHLLAYVEMLERDRGRITDAARRADECPLGAGALAATTFPIDREGVATELGFSRITRNSLDAAGDRDFAIELCAACALGQAHLSRLCEELVSWASQEVGFVTLPEGYSSGSSIMPQKMNPDIPELVRGKVGRVVGDWVALMTTLKALPLAYNKDLQETQEPLFDAVETLGASLEVMAGLIRAVEFRADRLGAAAGEGYLLATELCDYLAAKGVPFRDAHSAAGAVVRAAMAAGKPLAALSLEELRAHHPGFDEDVLDWLDVARAVDRRDVPGGPAKNRVAAELSRVKRTLAERKNEKGCP